MRKNVHYFLLFATVLWSHLQMKAQTCTNAQLEMAASAIGAVNPTTNGPAITDQIITFRNNTNNPVGTTFANYAPALTATYSLSNQQYTGVTGLTGNYANGIVYGAALNSTVAPVYDNLGAIGSTVATNFSSTPYDIGAGISTTVNFGPRFLFGTRGIQNAVGNTQLTSSFYMGDITITFNQPVNYPILNFSDFGGFLTAGTTHTFSLQAKITSGQTLTMLSGDAGVSVVGGDSIASVVSGTTATNNFLDGCFMVNQAGVTSITFKAYIQGHNNTGSWSQTAAGSNSGEAIVISITVPDLVPNAPVPTDTTITNYCPSTSFNLDQLLPTAVAGQTFEWHTVASNPSAANLVSNTTSQTMPGAYYLYAKDSLTGCYSSASAVSASATQCPVSTCTTIPDLWAAPGQTLNINGTNVSLSSGNAGTAISTGQGSPVANYLNTAAMGTTNATTVDNNVTNWTSYIWIRLHFDSPTILQSPFNFQDLDGNAGTNAEMGTIIGQNGTTIVTPTYSAGISLAGAATGTINDPTGITLGTVTAYRQTGSYATTDDDARNIFSADFGAQPVTDVYFMWGIAGNTTATGAQYATISSQCLEITVPSTMTACTTPPYTIYEYNRANATNTSNLPVEIIGATTTNVTLDQRTLGSDLTYDGLSWKLLASNIIPDNNNKIEVKFVPTAATTGTYLFTDAILITNGFNTIVLDNNDPGYSQTGLSWVSQTAFGYLNDNNYLSPGPFTSKTATWSFTNLPTAVTPPTPIPTAQTISKICPATTYDLTSLNPTNTLPAGYSYQWHTGTPSTASNVILNPSTASGVGPYYLSIDGPSGCFSGSSIPVIGLDGPCVCPIGIAPYSSVGASNFIQTTYAGMPNGGIGNGSGTTGTGAIGANNFNINSNSLLNSRTVTYSATSGPKNILDNYSANATIAAHRITTFSNFTTPLDYSYRFNFVDIDANEIGRISAQDCSGNPIDMTQWTVEDGDLVTGYTVSKTASVLTATGTANNNGIIVFTPPPGVQICSITFDVTAPTANVGVPIFIEKINTSSCCGALSAGVDKTACESGTATMAATQGAFTGTWTEIAGNPGTSSITSPTSETTTITNFSADGTYNYLWSNGFCWDTASVIVTICPTPDTITKILTCSTCPITACPTADELPSAAGSITYSSCGTTPSGFGTTSTVNPSTGCITFTPNGTQGPMDTVKTCLVACKNGVCDTTFIIIPPLVTPDTVVKIPSCPTCPINACPTADDLTSNPGTTTYTSCGTTPSGFGTTSTVNPSTGCITFTPNGTQGPMDTVKTCLVACKDGVCDTTFIIIPPVVTPDTVVKIPSCPTCPINACPTADDLTTNPGTTTYSSCGTTPSGFGTTSTVNPSTGCITFIPNGTQGPMDTVKTCLVACKNGVCDTTFIIIPPLVTPDTVVKVPSCPTCPVTACATKDDLSTNPGTTTYTTCGVSPTGFGLQTLNTTTGCIDFIPNGTQGPGDTVKTCIVACKLGVCDTTFVIIPPVIVPDTITKVPACPTCPVNVCATQDDIDTTGGGTTYTTCGAPADYTVTGPDANGCMTLTGSGTQDNIADTTCIIACKNGICDTTVIIIQPPVKPDSVVIQSECPTCYTDPICATADDLPSGNGTTTYTSCGLTPAGYGSLSSINPTTGCFVFTGNATFTSVTLQTCIVACKNGVCDTTYITILPATPPYGPDTVNTQIACKTCPTNPICPTGDDLPSTGTASYQSCGLDANESAQGSLTFDANNCAIWTPNGNQTGTITTCVVKCMSNGITTICDTTYINILPAPIPDTVTKTPDCITCPVTICPTADDLPNYGNATYQNCGLDANEATQGSMTTDVNGCIVFTPNGNQTDTITTCVVKCIDGICDTTFIIIPPTPLTPNPDVNATWVNAPLTGDVSTNDNGYPIGTTYGGPTPVPGNPDASVPVIQSDGTYTFTSPVPGIFQFKVPVQACPTCPIDSVLLTITVLDSTINSNAPTANTDLAITPKNTAVTLPTLSNDKSTNIGTNGGLNPASVTVTNPPSNGTYSVNPVTGDITYTPNSGFVGKDTLYYQVCDSQAVPKCATACQIITIVDTATSPNTTLASDDFNSTSTGEPVSGNAIKNDMDAEGDVQTITPQVTEVPGKGILQLASDGSYTFTPAPGYVGPVEFPYEITDAKGATANATIYFVVKASNPLPASLTAFNVYDKNCKAYLTWTTLQELNVSHFEIQKSTNTVFETIGRLNAVGNSQLPQSYEYTDMNTNEGANVYRLHIVDVDGRSANSDKQSITIHCSGFEITLYPNPVASYANVAIQTESEETFDLRLMDVSGRIIYSSQVDISHQSKVISIPMSEFSDGIYSLRVSNGIDTRVFRIEKTAK